MARLYSLARYAAPPPAGRSLPDARREPAQTPFRLADPSRFRLERLAAGAPPAQQFLLAPLMPLGAVGVLFGPGGVGKSLIALDACLAVARRALVSGNLAFVAGPLGTNVPDEAGGAAVFLTLEDDAEEIHRRVASLEPQGSHEGLPCFVIPGSDLPDFDPSLVDASGKAAVLTDFAKTGIESLLDTISLDADMPVKLLVLDPAGDFINADEDGAMYVKPLMRQLRVISQRRKCTILLLGHVAKASDPNNLSMRGSGAWVANSRFAYSVRPVHPKEDKHLYEPVGNLKSNWVVGCLVKANHKGAPVGRQRLFERDTETGRLKDITPAAMTGLDDDAAMMILAECCIREANEADALTITNVRGVYEQRERFPEVLSRLPRARLRALAEAAIEAGLLRNERGAGLVAGPKWGARAAPDSS